MVQKVKMRTQDTYLYMSVLKIAVISKFSRFIFFFLFNIFVDPKRKKIVRPGLSKVFHHRWHGVVDLVVVQVWGGACASQSLKICCDHAVFFLKKLEQFLEQEKILSPFFISWKKLHAVERFCQFPEGIECRDQIQRRMSAFLKLIRLCRLDSSRKTKTAKTVGKIVLKWFVSNFSCHDPHQTYAHHSSNLRADFHFL